MNLSDELVKPVSLPYQ